MLSGMSLTAVRLDGQGEGHNYQGHKSAVEYLEQLQVGPPRSISHEEIKQLANVVFSVAQWTDLHPKSNRPLEESCPLYQLLAANLPTIKTLYDRFDVRTNNLRFELESLGFKNPNDMDRERETRERKQMEGNPVNRYKGFACAVIYVERFNVEAPQILSDDRLAKLADIVFEATKWTGQHPEYDFRINQSCPLFQLLATNLPPIASLPEHFDVRLRHLCVKLEELGFREKRKRLLIESKLRGVEERGQSGLPP